MSSAEASANGEDVTGGLIRTLFRGGVSRSARGESVFKTGRARARQRVAERRRGGRFGDYRVSRR